MTPAAAVPDRRRALALYGGTALASALLLAWVVPFGPFPLAVPFDYRGDAVSLAAMVKAVAEEGPVHCSRLGAPFGADIVAQTLGAWLPFAFTTVIVRLGGQPGLALNLLWLLTVVAAAPAAAWTLCRLSVPPLVAAAFALLYAFLPWGLYRNVHDPLLVSPLVPLLGLLCLRICGVGGAPGRGERRVLLAACVLQGLSGLDHAFFAAWLLLCATALGWVATRRADLARAGALGLALLALGAAPPLVPTALHRLTQAPNPRLQDRLAAEADHQGLKLRPMLTPIDEHPLAPWRDAADRIRRAAFHDDTESTRSRIGTIAALGLVALLGFAVARAAGARGPDSSLGPPAALVIAALLLAGAGGLGSLWNALVVPAVRAYDRMAVFVAFFGLHGAAVLTSRLLARLPPWPRRSLLRAAALLLLCAAGLRDQLPSTFLGNARWSSAPSFAADASFVTQLEAGLPAGAQVFQLPQAGLPTDAVFGAPPDGARAYLHSRTSRWSWGAVVGRDGDWQQETSRLAPAAMAPRLALAGFDGVWIERAVAGGTPAPETLANESALAAAAGATPMLSADRRLSFIPLDALRGRLGVSLGPEGLRSAREAALADQALVPEWRYGCSAEHGPARARVCGRRASAILRNPSEHERRLVLSAGLRAVHPGRLRVSGPGFRDELPLAGEPVPYRHELTLGPGGALRLELAFDGPCEAVSPRAHCLEMADMKASGR